MDEASHSEPDIASSSQIADVEAVYQELVEADEYRHYAEYRDKFDVRMVPELRSIAEQLAPENSAVQRTRSEYESLKDAPVSKVYITYSLLMCSSAGYLVLALGSYIQLGFGPAQQVYPFFHGLLVFVSAVAVFVATVAIRIEKAKARQQIATVLITLDLKRREFDQKRLTLVREAFSRTVNDVLGPDGKLPFPVRAPRLVELDSSEVISSASARYLLEFVSGHASSAIGLAGPRGSGKSTLMRGLMHDKKLQALAVFMTAPVRYESTDFLKRLYKNIAEYVDTQHGFPTNLELRFRSRRVLQTRRRVTTAALGIGLSLVMIDGFATAYPSDLILPKFGATGILGLVLTGYGFAASVGSTEASRRYRRSSLGDRAGGDQMPSSYLASQALHKLSYSSESNSKNKNVGKLFGGLFTLEDEDSLTLKDRDLSHADLVSGLKRLLLAFAQERAPRPVLICIDELDKISLTSDLIETVNDLKDLFHVEGVHFVVSVSTDALTSFEQRGLPSRDAFDSSFDTIVGVTALTLEESLLVLSARAEGFPPIVGAFCHAWAGGLPRDLLRTARRCVEIQRSQAEALSIDALVRAVVIEDILAIIEGRLRAARVTVEDRVALCALRERTMGFANVRQLPENHHSVEAPTDAFHRVMRTERAQGDRETEVFAPPPDPALGSIASIVDLGEALIEYFAARGAVAAEKWLKPAETVFEAAAKAMSSRGDIEEIRNEVFQTALDALRSSK